MAVRVLTLGSGSTGNATVVTFGTRHLLLDAGLAARCLEERLAAVGLAPRDLDRILLTHEHGDHTRGLERFARKHRVPVACAPEVLEAMDLSPVHFSEWLPLHAGRPVEIDGVGIEPFAVPHDAAAPVGFVLAGEGVRVGIAVDLGHVTTLVTERLRGCHVLLVEANHDEGLLRDGPYPWHLKQRVGGRMGHLSNGQAAELVSRCAGDDLQAVVLAHLSERNNRPAMARNAVSAALPRGSRAQLRVADPRRPTPAVEI